MNHVGGTLVMMNDVYANEEWNQLLVITVTGDSLVTRLVKRLEQLFSVSMELNIIYYTTSALT